MQTALITCPWCGSQFETRLDGIPGTQRYTEDCQTCCQPIDVELELDHRHELVRLEVRQENE